MEKIKYKMSARTTILLGRESVSKVDGALIELIKNTYDADASACFIVFDDVTHKIYIIDDGIGMTKDVIENCWMMIGTDNKKINYESLKNRIKSGEKGIGRFALDRLGSKCEMFTRHKMNNTIHWMNNWNDFEEEGKSLDEVEATIEEVDSELLNNLPSEIRNELINMDMDFSHGTILVIENLRDDWNEKSINKIFNSLSTILPPSDQKDFRIYIKKSINTDFEELENIYEDDFDYRITSVFDGETFHIKIERNEFDLNQMPKALFDMEGFDKEPYRFVDFERGIIEKHLTIKELLKKSDETLINNVKKIGAFKFTYIFMKLSLQEDSVGKFYYKNVGQGRANWLNNHSGIKIYRDNFAVRPYGDMNSDAFDWLGLDARRSKDPAGIAHPRETWHVRNKQGQGTIFISRIANNAILDKSSREGIIENDSFMLLKEVIIQIISEFEKDRAHIGHVMSEYQKKTEEDERTKEYGKTIAKKVKKNKKKSVKLTSEEQKVLADTIDLLNNEKDELISENKLLRSLATNGLITTSIVHDLKTIQGSLINRADLLREAIEVKNNKYIESNLNDLKTNDKFLASWIEIITNQKKDKRTRKKSNLIQVIGNIVELLRPILSMKVTQIDYDYNERIIEKRIFVNDIESIIYNLVINSIEIFEQKKVINRKISIDVEIENDNVIIKYSDNGPGLDSSFKDPYEIFRYGVTTKRDVVTGEIIGTGLGMYIVDSTINEYNGRIIITKYRNEFELKLIIPR